MSGPEFFQTGMGRKFFEHDVPRIADALERLANLMQKLVDMEEEREKGGSDADKSESDVV
jgi:hypothetical protein